MAVKRIQLLNVPIDILAPEKLEETLLGLLERPGTKQIVFLNLWDFLKARRNTKFRECLTNAELVLPISKSLLKGAAFLELETPVRYNPFSCNFRFSLQEPVSFWRQKTSPNQGRKKRSCHL